MTLITVFVFAFRVLSVVSLEPCEFLKISKNDYERVIQVEFLSFKILTITFANFIHLIQ